MGLLTFFCRFYGLTERMTKMEATVAPLINKLDRILERIDDAWRMKKQKKDQMQGLIQEIEDNADRKIIFTKNFTDLVILVDDAAKGLQIRDIASRMEYY